MNDSIESSGQVGNQPGELAVARQRPMLRDIFDVNALKSIGTFLGIVGAGGGGFAALCFGIGYLAVKNHDEMVGIPSTSMNYTTYVRTGAVFFPSFIHNMFVAGVIYVLLAGFASIIVMMGLTFIRSGSKYNLLQKLRLSGQLKLVLFELSYLPVLALGVYVLLLQVASFDPLNKDLIHRALVSPDTTVVRSPAELADVSLPPMKEVLMLGSSDAFARQIRYSLQARGGSGRLTRLFGHEALLMLLYVYLLLLMWRWRHAYKTTGPEAGGDLPKRWRDFFLIDWLMQPLLVAIGIALVLNVPATYGVLCMSRQGAWVEINDEKRGAYLLSDLSSEPSEIWTLGNEGKEWVLRVYHRDHLEKILMTGYFTENILALATHNEGGDSQ